MESSKFWSLIRGKKWTILSVAFLFFFLSLAITFISPLEYRATTKLLITQNDNSGDAYTLSRSNQFLSSVLSEVVYSSSFFDQVLKAGFNIDQTIFSSDQNKNMKKWRHMVSARSIGDTGMIVIDTYNKDKYQVSQVNQAVAYILQTKNSLYHGLGDKVSVKVIDKTSVSDWPVKPNIILNAILGVIFGLIIGFCFAYLYPEKKFITKKDKKLASCVEENYKYTKPAGDFLVQSNFPWESKKDFSEMESEIKEKEPEIIMNKEEEKEGEFFVGDINNLL
ncbi:MAG: Wzz/FepE/Etk N-terminal domain-containing protein [Patescibacteria group bacterium]